MSKLEEEILVREIGKLGGFFGGSVPDLLLSACQLKSMKRRLTLKPIYVKLAQELLRFCRVSEG
jgi:hypothetical protein